MEVEEIAPLDGQRRRREISTAGRSQSPEKSPSGSRRRGLAMARTKSGSSSTSRRSGTSKDLAAASHRMARRSSGKKTRSKSRDATEDRVSRSRSRSSDKSQLATSTVRSRSQARITVAKEDSVDDESDGGSLKDEGEDVVDDHDDGNMQNFHQSHHSLVNMDPPSLAVATTPGGSGSATAGSTRRRVKYQPKSTPSSTKPKSKVKAMSESNLQSTSAMSARNLRHRFEQEFPGEPIPADAVLRQLYKTENQAELERIERYKAEFPGEPIPSDEVLKKLYVNDPPLAPNSMPPDPDNPHGQVFVLPLADGAPQKPSRGGRRRSGVSLEDKAPKNKGSSRRRSSSSDKLKMDSSSHSSNKGLEESSASIISWEDEKATRSSRKDIKRDTKTSNRSSRTKTGEKKPSSKHEGRDSLRQLSPDPKTGSPAWTKREKWKNKSRTKSAPLTMAHLNDEMERSFSSDPFVNSLNSSDQSGSGNGRKLRRGTKPENAVDNNHDIPSLFWETMKKPPPRRRSRNENCDSDPFQAINGGGNEDPLDAAFGLPTTISASRDGFLEEDPFQVLAIQRAAPQSKTPSDISFGPYSGERAEERLSPKKRDRMAPLKSKSANFTTLLCPKEEKDSIATSPSTTGMLQPPKKDSRSKTGALQRTSSAKQWQIEIPNGEGIAGDGMLDIHLSHDIVEEPLSPITLATKKVAQPAVRRGRRLRN